MISESDFSKPLHDALNAPTGPTRVDRQNAGLALDRSPSGRVRGAVHGARPGAGDLAGWARGHGWHIEVEVKVLEPWTAEQRARAAALARDGGIYVLVRWQPEIDLDANVARGVALVGEAISERARREGLAHAAHYRDIERGVIGGDPR